MALVLVKSLNAGMAIAAERMKQKDMQACLAAFGFGAETRCGIPGESAGLVTGPKKWSATPRPPCAWATRSA